MVLEGLCEQSCIILNQIHDGGMRNGLDCTKIENTINVFPYCLGLPPKDDMFHFRNCIEKGCRSDEQCSEESSHPRENDIRGCNAGKRFKQGLYYDFEYAEGQFIRFESLLQITDANLTSFSPTALPTQANLTSFSPTALPSQANLTTFSPSPLPTALPAAAAANLALIIPVSIASFFLLILFMILFFCCFCGAKKEETTEAVVIAEEPRVQQENDVEIT
jgi:hypothetical protein